METQVGELEPMKAEINEAYAELDKWARPRRVKTSLTWVAAKPTVYSEPKGRSSACGGGWSSELTPSRGSQGSC